MSSGIYCMFLSARLHWLLRVKLTSGAFAPEVFILWMWFIWQRAYRKPPWGTGRAGCFLNISIHLRCFLRLYCGQIGEGVYSFIVMGCIRRLHNHTSIISIHLFFSHYRFQGKVACVSVWRRCRGILRVGWGRTRLGCPRPNFITSCFFTRSVPVFSLGAKQEGRRHGDVF